MNLWGYEYTVEELDGEWKGYLPNDILTRDTYESLMKAIRTRLFTRWLGENGFKTFSGNWVRDGLQVSWNGSNWVANSNGTRFTIHGPEDLDPWVAWFQANGFTKIKDCWYGHQLRLEKGGSCWKVHGKGYWSYVTEPEQIRGHMNDAMVLVLQKHGYLKLRDNGSADWRKGGSQVFFDGAVWRIGTVTLRDAKHLESLISMESVLKANGFTNQGSEWVKGALRVVKHDSWVVIIGSKGFVLRDEDHLLEFVKAVEKSLPQYKATRYQLGRIIVECEERNRVTMIRKDTHWRCEGMVFESEEAAMDYAIQFVRE